MFGCWGVAIVLSESLSGYQINVQVIISGQ